MAQYFVENDTNGTYDIFVRDRQIGNTTERVSVNSAGDESNGQSWEPSLSADGNLVAFSSYADNLVSDDSNGYSDIFVHNRATGVTTRVSVASNGAEGNDNAPLQRLHRRRWPLRCFESYADNLAPDDFNGTEDIFLHDMQTGQTELIYMRLMVQAVTTTPLERSVPATAATSPFCQGHPILFPATPATQRTFSSTTARRAR